MMRIPQEKGKQESQEAPTPSVASVSVSCCMQVSQKTLPVLQLNGFVGVLRQMSQRRPWRRISSWRSVYACCCTMRVDLKRLKNSGRHVPHENRWALHPNKVVALLDAWQKSQVGRLCMVAVVGQLAELVGERELENGTTPAQIPLLRTACRSESGLWGPHASQRTRAPKVLRLTSWLVVSLSSFPPKKKKRR